MINLKKNKDKYKRAIERAREKKIIIPTLKQQKNPVMIPDKVKLGLKKIGLWDIDPLNLFRISWKNEPKEKGGLHDEVNFLELPSSLTGVQARIFALIGKWFPTGCHKVGASFGCLVPPLITGQFDPSVQKAVWPSTGNYCRGGAYNSRLLGCDSIAILPQGMSSERFEWLKTVATEVIATPGTESNVKEIYDKCHELRATRKDIMIFNQFEEMGNHLWHYEVTGNAMEEVFQNEMGEKGRLAGVCLTSGSAGTLGCGDYLKKQYPGAKIAVGEALQCPTLVYNGYGAHRIEGIGDKHIPWVHNVRNTDLAIAIDDEDSWRLVRLFNDPVGREYMINNGVPEKLVEKLDLLGISGIANLLTAIKFAKYYELTDRDAVFTVCTDSMQMYGSRLLEQKKLEPKYGKPEAARDFHRHLLGLKTDHMLELSYYDRKRIHNLKYYTWVEQQGKTVEELNAQWYDSEYWESIHAQAPEIDKLIDEFNDATGLLKNLK
ncbi:MAG: pyridoxal-phosphate dependent enzyme [Candidatus Wallbacteria bacterium]|nr:pyridoxal-phosphate dependent enzyme [Candidatus Wallbacteria bacterium]